MTKALIIIDMQNDFIYNKKSPVYIAGSEKIIESIKKIRSIFLKNNFFIINIITNHLKDKSNWGKKDLDLNRYYCIEKTNGIKIIKDLNVNEKEEIIIEKSNYNGFYKTELLNILKKNKIGKLYFSGVTTGCCVSSTARAAYDYGFELYFIKECLISSDFQAHEFELKFFEKSLGKVINIDEI